MSVVPYIASAGLGAYETHRLQEEEKQRKYTDRCLPTERPVDALLAGLQAEREAAHSILSEDPEKKATSQDALVKAYTYYRIAGTVGDNRAEARLINIRNFMPKVKIEQAEEEFQKYTLENILSCYVQPETSF